MVFYENINDGQVYAYDETDESQLPYIQQAIDNGWKYIGDSPLPPPPPTAEENKATAVYKLQLTDWATIADVGNPQMSNPYLANQEEFITYRNSIRTIAVYPTDGYLNWEEEPKAIWQTS
jgi:hypothetical protein